MAQPEPLQLQDIFQQGALPEKRLEFLVSYTRLTNLFLSPVVIYLIYNGFYSLAAIEIIFLILLNVKTYRMRLGQACPVSFSLVIFTLAIALIWGTYRLGPAAALWTYPIFAALYFVIPTKRAHLIAASIILPITIIVIYQDGYSFGFRYFASFVCMMVLANKIIEIVTELQMNLLESAIRDPLTNAYNRRYMDKVISDEITHYSRDQLPLSLLILDIDFFKQVNDNFGHDVGDIVLKAVVDKIGDSVRANDAIFRIGGEEFVVLFRNTSVEDAEMLADKLRIELASIDLLDHDLSITVSIGVAAYQDGFSKDDWLKLADDCLYCAKRRGRNGVVICNDYLTALQESDAPAH